MVVAQEPLRGIKNKNYFSKDIIKQNAQKFLEIKVAELKSFCIFAVRQTGSVGVDFGRVEIRGLQVT
ncbi:hypothetical protein [Chryseobacterium wanjuense]